MTGVAYFILTRVLIKHEGNQSKLALAVRDDMKTKISIGLCGRNTARVGESLDRNFYLRPGGDHMVHS